MEDDFQNIGAVMKKISDAEIWILEQEVEMYSWKRRIDIQKI